MQSTLWLWTQAALDSRLHGASGGAIFGWRQGFEVRISHFSQLASTKSRLPWLYRIVSELQAPGQWSPGAQPAWLHVVTPGVKMKGRSFRMSCKCWLEWQRLHSVSLAMKTPSSQNIIISSWGCPQQSWDNFAVHPKMISVALTLDIGGTIECAIQLWGTTWTRLHLTGTILPPWTSMESFDCTCSAPTWPFGC